MHRRHDRDEIDWERLDRLVCGDGAPGERQSLATWASADVSRVALVQAMRTIGRPSSDSAFRPDARPALARVQRRLRLDPRPAVAGQRT
jgi:hypothetical protein